MIARENPFRTERVLSLRYRFAESTWDDFLRRLETCKWRGAILGPHGSGKTTLIEDLVPRLEARGFAVTLHTLSAERRRLDPERLGRPGPEDFILLDGAEQLGPLGWRRFRWAARRAGGLVITAHSLQRRARRLPILWRCETSLQLVDGLLEELDQSSRRERARELFAARGGNVREVLRGLYDLLE